VPKQITLRRLTMAARYSCMVLVSVGTVPSVLTPCAAIWVTEPLHPGPACETNNAGAVGNQSESACQTPHSACVRRPIRLLTASADYTAGPVCCLRQYTGHSHTLTACMQNGLNINVNLYSALSQKAPLMRSTIELLNYRGLPAVPLCISRPLIRC